MAGKVTITIAAVSGLVLLALILLGQWSQKPPPLGLVNGQLNSCPESPNCVCSETWPGKSNQHEIQPFSLSGVSQERAWPILREAIVKSGGKITTSSGQYLHATFTSAIFRFVDDVEARLDVEQEIIHLRSASRVGRSDLGANRKRIEAIRDAYHSSLKIER